MTARNQQLGWDWLWLAGFILAAVLPASVGRAISCSEIDTQCMLNGTCQIDGSCLGEALPDTTQCNDDDVCTINDHCHSGYCTGDPAPPSTTCDDFNECTTGDHCQNGVCRGTAVASGTSCSFGQCTGQCQVMLGYAYCNAFRAGCSESDLCHVCNPATGQCTVGNQCTDECQTGQCDPATGDCINYQPKADGTACGEVECGATCQSGTCTAGTPGPTSTPTAVLPTPTATVPSTSACTGDCDGHGSVTVDEILTMVNIALGNANVSVCPAGDANHNQAITVDEILTAVNNALNGCPIPPTPVPTATQPPATPTSTHGPATATATNAPGTPTTTPANGSPSIPKRAAGTIESTTQAFMVIPDLLSAVLKGASKLPGGGAGSGSAAMNIIPPIAFQCSTGSGSVSCDQPSLLSGPATYTVTFAQCQVSSGTGTTLTFNGTLTVTGQTSDKCTDLKVPTNATVATQNLTVTSSGTYGSTVATFSGFSASLQLSDSGSAGQCKYDTAQMSATGTVTVVTKDTQGNTLSTTQIAFGAGSTISLQVTAYSGSDCVPTAYTMILNGSITLTTDGYSFEGNYIGYTLEDDSTSGQDLVSVGGMVESPCFGTAVTLSTTSALVITGGACPIDGSVMVMANTNFDTITFTATGGVQIQPGMGGDVQTFSSCLDPRLYVCPAS